jgi:hypothetical protein
MATENETLNIQALQERALSLWKVDETCALQLGRALVAVREAMRAEGHGNFTAWYRAAKLSENRVQYCLRLAEGKVDKAKTQEGWSAHPTAIMARNVTTAITRDMKQSFELNKGKTANFAHSVILNAIHTLYVNFFDEEIFVNHNENAAVEAAYAGLQSALHHFVDTAYQQPLAANLSQ